MPETSCFLTRGSGRRFARLHVPDAEGSGLGWVFVHPFGEEKLWSHRVFVHMARRLAAEGDAVLRVDLTGAGDSDGDTASAGLEDYEADVRIAIDALVSHRPALRRIGLLGLRLGATIAARVAEAAQWGTADRLARLAPLVLWEPIVDGAQWLQELLKVDLSAQLATHGRVIETREAMLARLRAGGEVDIEGYGVGRPLVTGCDLVRTDAPPSAHRGPVLVASIAPAARARPRHDLDALAARYQRADRIAADAPPFWRELKDFVGGAESLEERTLAWRRGIL